MLKRIVTAAFLLPVVAAIYLGPRWLFLALATVASVLMALETLHLFEAAGARPVVAPVVVGAVALNLAFHAPGHLPVEGALALAAAGVFGCWLLMRTPAGALAGIGAMLFALVYPCLLIGFQVGIRGLAEGEADGRRGPALLVFMYAAVFGSDAGAYFTGRALGRIPLAPLVSPKKTLEGFLGGLLCGVLLSAGFASWLPTGLPPGKAAFLGGVLAVAGAFGDLSKSVLKRAADVKDSGTMLPGHGGILDRLDGLLFASPVMYLMMTSPVLAMTGAGGG